jgi:hypothetical protein
MILLYCRLTEEKEADFAIFLTPAGGIFAITSTIALELTSLELMLTIEVPLL